MSDDLVKRLRDKWQHDEELCFSAAYRIKELEREIALDGLDFDALQAERDELSRRLAETERQLAEARNAALEEAAMAISCGCDEGECRSYMNCPAADITIIRALKTEQP